MLGTVLNSISIIVGSFIGVFFGSKFSGHLRDTFYAILGTFTTFMGIGMFLESENSIVCLASLVLGTFIGEAVRLEEKVESAGARVISFSARFYGTTRQEESDQQRMIKGFVTASLFFVTGPVGILGSFQSGLSGKFDLLIMKSLLDGITSIVFASVMGIGVAFSALPVLVYQGLLTLFFASVPCFFVRRDGFGIDRDRRDLIRHDWNFFASGAEKDSRVLRDSGDFSGSADDVVC